MASRSSRKTKGRKPGKLDGRSERFWGCLGVVGALVVITVVVVVFNLIRNAM